MIGAIRRRALSLGLALSVAAAGLPGVGQAADEPDLKLEYVRLFTNAGGQVNDQVVSFKVTNVGNQDAPEGTGKLEILSPAPAREEALKIPELAKDGGTFEGFAQLGAPCDGHIVRVAVYAPGESAFDDNTLGPLKLCPDKPEPAPAPKPEAPAPSGDIPEHLRPGSHRAGGQFPPLTFKPSAVKSVIRAKDGGVFQAGGLLVGWHQEEVGDLWNHSSAAVYQTAVNFDLSKFDEVPNPFGLKALLTFDERAVKWTHGDGSPKLVNSCVSVLGIATVDWAAQRSVNALFPNRAEWDAPGGKKEWDVTWHVYDQINDRGNRALRYGYVLRGTLEDVRGEDDDSCLSEISNLQLTIEYAVIQ